MKKFSEFILEEDENEDDTGKRALISVINSNFQRLVNQPDVDNKALLILVAALGVLNSSDDPQSVATAKRLATLALSKKAKKKEK